MAQSSLVNNATEAPAFRPGMSHDPAEALVLRPSRLGRRRPSAYGSSTSKKLDADPRASRMDDLQWERALAEAPSALPNGMAALLGLGTSAVYPKSLPGGTVLTPLRNVSLSRPQKSLSIQRRRPLVVTPVQ